MINIYNIALLLISQSQKIIKYSQNFSEIAHRYLLGKHALPHVTLCQFLAGRKKAIKFWEHAVTLLSTEPIQLTFGRPNSMTFDNKTFWISLHPEPSDVLVKMHLQVAEIVKKPRNRSYENYSPHITLANTRSKEYSSFLDKLLEIYTPFTDLFFIALGKSDFSGQFLERLMPVPNCA